MQDAVNDNNTDGALKCRL